MAKGFKQGAGGAALNFKVVGGAAWLENSEEGVWNAINDTTAKGLSDSNRAMNYDKPSGGNEL